MFIVYYVLLNVEAERSTLMMFVEVRAQIPLGHTMITVEKVYWNLMILLDLIDRSNSIP